MRLITLFTLISRLIPLAGYEWVHETGKILHRDISINNIMYREDAKRISGVLIDYDLAVDVDRSHELGQSSKQRTGTKPFMAIGLLADSPETHNFKHDLESLFYCYLWMLLKNEVCLVSDKSDTTVHVHPLEEWETLPLRDLHDRKIALLSRKLGETNREFGRHSSVCESLKISLFWITIAGNVPRRSGDLFAAGARNPSPAIPSTPFPDFESSLCGDVMNELKKWYITNAPYHHELALRFQVI